MLNHRLQVTPPMTAPRRSGRVVVGKIEGQQIVLADAAGAEVVIMKASLPTACRREGAVFDLKIDSTGRPLWATASVNQAEEERRRIDAAAPRVEL